MLPADQTNHTHQRSQAPLLDKSHGQFASGSLTCSPQEAYQSCQDFLYGEKVLSPF